MDDFKPTTEQIRNGWAWIQATSEDLSAGYAEFDAWLAAHDAKKAEDEMFVDPEPWLYHDGTRRAAPLNQDPGNPFGVLWQHHPRTHEQYEADRGCPTQGGHQMKSATDAFEDAEIAREELREILNRGNVIQHWPDDEAAAYRDNGGWSEGMEAVENIRIDKIIELVSRQSPASTTAATATERECKMGGLGWGNCDAPNCKNPKRYRVAPGPWIEVAAPEGDGGNE